MRLCQTKLVKFWADCQTATLWYTIISCFQAIMKSPDSKQIIIEELFKTDLQSTAILSIVDQIGYLERVSQVSKPIFLYITLLSWPKFSTTLIFVCTLTTKKSVG